jgi:flagellar protein FlaG
MDVGAISQTGIRADGPSSTDRPGPVEAPAVSNREVARAVRQLQDQDVLPPNQELTMAVDRETRRTVVRIVDRQTREVLLQIPDERVLRLAEELGKR